MQFIKKKVDHLMGGTVVKFIEESSFTEPPTDTFELIASREGVCIQGTSPMFYNNKDLEIFAQALGSAWSEHLKMKPKFSTTLSGH